MANIEDTWQCKTANCGHIYNPEKDGQLLLAAP